MTVRWETIQVEGHPMRVYLGVPDRPGPHPAVVVIQHRDGVDTLIQDVVHRLFRAGYIVAAPEIYHRQPPDIEMAKRPGLLQDTEMLADVNATVAHIKSLPEGIGKIGIVGFCLGGRVSYLAAAAVKEIDAAAIFYGGNIMAARGDSPTPFERSADIHCPIIAFTGAKDVNPSPDDMRKISAELTRLGKVHEFHLYLDTDHGFQNFALGRYRERSSRASWTEMLAFFTEHLKRAA